VIRTEEFEQLRPLLFAIAYRILGSVAEAEDAVQETWLRYESSPTHPTSTKAFLSAVVTRVSIDVLRSARIRRERYVGQWFPEPLLSDPKSALGDHRCCCRRPSGPGRKSTFGTANGGLVRGHLTGLHVIWRSDFLSGDHWL
jgi:hypothetical protein